MNATGLFSDDLVDNSADKPDQLGYDGLAHRIVELLERVKSDNSSIVIGLVGPWGAGKSSTLAMVGRRLQEPMNSWIVTEFNPWLYPDIDSLVLGFFRTLIGALPGEDRWNSVRERVGRLGEAVSPLGKLTTLVGLDTQALISAASRAIAGKPTADRAKAQAIDALTDLGLPILIVLDDLDRLQPSELLLTFKLVRLLGRLPHVHYLLAYDEETLLDSLRRTELVGDDHKRALSYLEKIVQVRIDMPPLRQGQVTKLFDELTDALLTRHPALTMSESDIQRFSDGFWAHLCERLQTPRAIKRLFAQVELYLDLVEQGELNFVDLFFITFLRTFEPALYKVVYRSKSRLVGPADSNAALGNKLTPLESRDHWMGVLEAAHVTQQYRLGILDLLGVLFLPIEHALGETSPGFADYEDAAARRGVGHADYFERYFASDVPDEDLPDHLAASAIKVLMHGGDDYPILRVTEALKSDTAKVLRKLDAQAGASAASKIALLRFLASAYGSLPGSAAGLATNGKRLSYKYGQKWLTQLDTDRRIEGCAVMCCDLSGVKMAANVVARVARDDDSKKVWSECATYMSERIAKELKPLEQAEITALGHDPMNLLWMWSNIDEPAAVAWVNGQLTTERWNLLDFLALQIPIFYGATGASLGDFDMSAIDHWLDRNVAIARLKTEYTDYRGRPKSWHVPPTIAARRELVLAGLKSAAELSANGGEVTQADRDSGQ